MKVNTCFSYVCFGLVSVSHLTIWTEALRKYHTSESTSPIRITGISKSGSDDPAIESSVTKKETTDSTPLLPENQEGNSEAPTPPPTTAPTMPDSSSPSSLPGREITPEEESEAPTPSATAPEFVFSPFSNPTDASEDHECWVPSCCPRCRHGCCIESMCCSNTSSSTTTHGDSTPKSSRIVERFRSSQMFDRLKPKEMNELKQNKLKKRKRKRKRKTSK